MDLSTLGDQTRLATRKGGRRDEESTAAAEAASTGGLPRRQPRRGRPAQPVEGSSGSSWQIPQAVSSGKLPIVSTARAPRLTAIRNGARPESPNLVVDLDTGNVTVDCLETQPYEPLIVPGVPRPSAPRGAAMPRGAEPSTLYTPPAPPPYRPPRGRSAPSARPAARPEPEAAPSRPVTSLHLQELLETRRVVASIAGVVVIALVLAFVPKMLWSSSGDVSQDSPGGPADQFALLDPTAGIEGWDAFPLFEGVESLFPAPPADVSGVVTPGPLGVPERSARLVLGLNGEVLVGGETRAGEIADGLTPIGSPEVPENIIFAVDAYSRSRLANEASARWALDQIFGTAGIPAVTPFLTEGGIPGSLEVVDLVANPDIDRGLLARVIATPEWIVVLTVTTPPGVADLPGAAFLSGVREA